MPARYSIGLDYGTNSVRALLVSVADGREVAVATWDYAHGRQGVVLSADPNLARQHPADYVTGAEITLKKLLAQAKHAVRGFKPEHVIGLGVDTTGSTPIPVDAAGHPLALSREFQKNPAAMAWLWKDHTSWREAARITELAARHRPQFIAKCGNTYSSEWFWSKIWHCLAARTRARLLVPLAPQAPKRRSRFPAEVRLVVCDRLGRLEVGVLRFSEDDEREELLGHAHRAPLEPDD